ncbi:hypothetical protein GYMLUDRAFT_57884 [Collybiopsis luxurians FD-317 M1]|uniref:Angiogenic factor with G patch and FHA domains 1 n=1 Tax=Collybiopsis luxurians FD-317 M1 TaxID=944289 RepID=A0A0D0C4T6_9AGAR|nr:hypothetical protein GYMLUDRAFT_57884 [Collybiopsis luxurians FD-317 M1]
MEDGEIPFKPSQAVWSSGLSRAHASSGPSSDYAHDQSYEWPWDAGTDGRNSGLEDCGSHSGRERNSGSPKTLLRLLVLKSRALPESRIAVIDVYSQVQLGRDNPVSENIPRIRLKEMEVSKLHATIYWDEASNTWGVVDMGSKHGTFLRHSNGLNADRSQFVDREIRLSSPRTASIPQSLYHLDQLTLGTTTFVVHIHESRLPCEECSPGVGEDIPLFASEKKRLSTKDISSSRTLSSKAALQQLKRKLISRHSMSSDLAANTSQYVDRSARRRALYPASSADAPGLSSTPSSHSATPPLRAEPTSQPAVPIPTTSLGYKLLVKQGWHAGTSLGITEGGRIEPLELKSNFDRSGLGSKNGDTFL